MAILYLYDIFGDKLMGSMFKQWALTLALAIMGLTVAQAATPTGKLVSGMVALQGGSASEVKWLAPFSSTFIVHVFVPKTGTAKEALYRIYPNGKKPGGTSCVSSDASYPCFEVTVDQTLHQNSWVPLTLNHATSTQWVLIKDKGYVTAVADNLGAAEQLNVSAQVRFQDMVRVIGNRYQGGIIFYIDRTGEHGLVAGRKDLSIGIPWYNGSFIATGATGTAIGTGLANTHKIIKAQGAGNYAAKLCADLVDGPYTGWYLPSKDELDLMYRTIGPAAPAPLTNVGKFDSRATYWSSSEDSADLVWVQSFLFGDQGNIDKLFPFHVRAVRAF